MSTHRNNEKTPVRFDDLTIVINAGGMSSRMGQSKATVAFNDAPMILQTLNRVAPMAGEVIITTNEPENLEFLHDREDEIGPVRLVTDILDTRSALGGLYTALQAASKPYLAVVACDMVLVSRRIIRAEYKRLKACDADLIVPRTSNGWEPFYAVYRTQRCRPIVSAAAQAGEHKMTMWYDQVKIDEITLEELRESGASKAAFINVNTPEELVVAQAMALNEYR